MGGSSSKKSFFGRKKKDKSALRSAWSRLRGALPVKKHKKKNILSLDKFNLDNLKREERSQKGFSLSRDRKESISIKGVSLGRTRKEPVSVKTLSLGKKGQKGGGIGRVGEQIKRFSLGNTRKSSPPRPRFSLPL